MEKKKIWLIPIILLVITTTITSVSAYYFSKVEPNLTTTFELEYDAVFVRAYIITYWEDESKGEIVAKSSWNLKEGITSNLWTNIDGIYYYNGTITRTEVEQGLSTSNYLIDETLNPENLSNDDLTDLKYTAKYKVVYEFLEADADENGVLSCEEAWQITYSNNGVPTKIS